MHTHIDANSLVIISKITEAGALWRRPWEHWRRLGLQAFLLFKLPNTTLLFSNGLIYRILLNFCLGQSDNLQVTERPVISSQSLILEHSILARSLVASNNRLGVSRESRSTSWWFLAMGVPFKMECFCEREHPKI